MKENRKEKTKAKWRGEEEKKKRRKSRIRYGGEEKDRNQDGLLQQLQRAMTQGYTTYSRFNSGGIYTYIQRYGHSRLRAEIYINRFLQASSPGEPGSLHLWLMMSAPASLATGPFSASFGFLLEAWMIIIRTSMEFGDGENALCHSCLAALLPCCPRPQVVTDSTAGTNRDNYSVGPETSPIQLLCLSLITTDPRPWTLLSTDRVLRSGNSS